jgi:very-short-patch-repair endonuclease
MYRDSDQRDFARRLRNQPTGAEKRLWFHLRAGQLNGRKFRRQAALGAYIVDFICFAQRLIVELDGPQHFEAAAAEHDARRTAWLAERGYRVIRFRNHEVDEDVQRVVEMIRQALEVTAPTPPHPPSPTLPSRGREPDRIE